MKPECTCGLDKDDIAAGFDHTTDCKVRQVEELERHLAEANAQHNPHQNDFWLSSYPAGR